MNSANVGTTSIGGSWLDMSANTGYMQPITVTGLLSEVRAHIRHDVANVPSITAVMYSDDSGAPDYLLIDAMLGSSSILATATGRWFSFPVGRWFESATTVWVGIYCTGNQFIDLAYETSGGSGGSRAGLSDSATWTSGSNDYSIYGVVLT